MKPTLADLTSTLSHAKVAEANAKATRIQAEEAIIAFFPSLKEKGSTTTDAGNGLSVTLTTGLTYKCDLKALYAENEEIACAVAKAQPEKLDEKAYEHLSPEHKAIASKFVTVTPKKVSVTLKVK